MDLFDHVAQIHENVKIPSRKIMPENRKSKATSLTVLNISSLRELLMVIVSLWSFIGSFVEKYLMTMILFFCSKSFYDFLLSNLLSLKIIAWPLLSWKLLGNGGN